MAGLMPATDPQMPSLAADKANLRQELDALWALLNNKTRNNYAKVWVGAAPPPTDTPGQWETGTLWYNTEAPTAP